MKEVVSSILYTYVWFIPAYYLSVFLHEISHLVTGLFLRLPIERLSLFAGEHSYKFHFGIDIVLGYNLFGSNHIKIVSGAYPWLYVFIVIAAGPMINLIITVISITYATKHSYFLLALFGVNLALFIFAIYPADGSDGAQLINITKQVLSKE